MSYSRFRVDRIGPVRQGEAIRPVKPFLLRIFSYREFLKPVPPRAMLPKIPPEPSPRPPAPDVSS